MSIPTPPRATVKPHAIIMHGHTRTDNYYWLREKTSREVLDHLEAENAYTQQVMAHTEDLQQQLYAEMVARIQETDQTAPVRRGDYFYYTRTEAGKQYTIHCRKKGSMEAAEEVLLDLNELATEHDYLKLGIFAVSPNQQILAYALDTDGAENWVVHFKDLATGQLLPEQLQQVSWTAVWANDNETFFYTVQDETKRSAYVYRHRLGTDPTQDERLHHETDERFSVGLGKTRDRAYLVQQIRSMETAECHILDADDANGTFRLVAPREEGVEYTLGHRNGRFYIVTNHQARNFKIVTAPATSPGKENWQDLLPHREHVKVDDVDLFAHHMVVYEREKGLRTLRITRFDTGETHYVDFPDPVYTYEQGQNYDFDSEVLRFTYTSLTTADSDIDYDMNRRTQTVVKQEPVLGGYDPANYRSERIWATVDDGAEVPISLVYRQDLDRTRPNLCLLYGYGSYGISMDPHFRRDHLSLLDRGFIFAIAHIRGGQEMGRPWYDHGKFLHKKNTFTDFIACGRHLIDAGYTSREQLAIMGRSAGGLLMGAVLNMAPDLCRLAVAGVPFVDVVTTMLDETIPLTVGEFEEWGNPSDETYYHYMLSYSPYDNLAATDYPHILVTAGLNDPRVQYWEPAKWVAKLRTLKTDDNRLLLKTFMGAGHFSSSGRYDHLKDTAFEYAFILDTLGVV